MNRNDMLNMIFVLLILIIPLSSCNMYSTNDIIKYGKEIINVHEDNLIKITQLIEKLEMDSCTMYKIFTSQKTDFFQFSEYSYNEKKGIVEEIKLLDFNETYKKYIWNVLPQDEITRFNFATNVYVSFRLNGCRSYDDESAKLIYCYDKEKLVKLFPEYSIYENIEMIVDTSNWIYFYGDKWAITTSSTFYKMSKQKCNQL